MKYLKYVLIFLSITLPCAIAVLIYNDKITQDAPTYYKQGVEFYEEGDYGNAYYNFGKISKISPLYPIALYKQAKSAQKVGDYKTAALKYKMYLEKEPKSLFSDTARLNYGKSCYYSKRYEEAQAILKDLTSQEALYYSGLTAKQLGNKENSARYLKTYIKNALNDESGNNVYILAAADELRALNIDLSQEDNKMLASAYYKGGKYKTALELYSKLPQSECWDRFVLANHYAGNKVIAKKLIETGLITYARNIPEENLRSIYNIYLSYLPGTRLKNRTAMHNIIKNHSLPGEDYIMYKLAEILPRDKALQMYKEIVAKYPNGDFAAESLWHIFYDKYVHKDYKTAETLAIKHLTSYKNVNSTPRMLYWAAKTFEKENKINESHACLNRLISKYRDDYYGLRAESVLEKRNDFWTLNPELRLPEKTEDPEFPILLSKIDIKDLKIINTLFNAGDYEIWQDTEFKNNIVKSWFELKKDKKSSSIVLARDELKKNEVKPPYVSSTYKLAYPLYWNEEINKLAVENGLDPYYITALIREESYFNPDAKSNTNATGLMQLMPETSNFIVTKIKPEVELNPEDPETNLYLGCNYLKYLKSRFNNDLLVTAAYNGGEGSVNKWLKQYGSEDYDVFIESIPYTETKNYVKKVYAAYHMYRKIYK